MKKINSLLKFLFVTAVALTLTGCPREPESGDHGAEAAGDFTEQSCDISLADLGGTVTKNQTVDGLDGVTVIKGSDNNGWAFTTVPLTAYEGKTVKVTAKVKMKVVDSTGAKNHLMWQLNNGDAYPVVAEKDIPSNKWVTFEGTTEEAVDIASGALFYLSNYQLTSENLTIYVKTLYVTVKEEAPDPNLKTWLDEPSLKEAYRGKIDKLGFSVSQQELNNTNIQAGLKHHVDTITMGNEFKPQFMFGWNGINANTKFTSSKGKEITVPSTLGGFGTMDSILKTVKDLGLTMRGHVLVWHSQTPNFFFKDNWTDSGKTVDKETMDARQEWYIKTVLEHVTEWENKNNDGKHIVWAWDVVNEAIADGNGGGLRTESNWYNIYGSNEFIINAFRYANKYAPKDVILCYNDYNEYETAKMNGICNLLDAIIAKENDETLPTRIDAMGMQAHASVNIPASTIETAVKKYIAKGLDIHVTELDIATEVENNQTTLAQRYKEYYNVYLKNRKTSAKNGVSSVTIWGLRDEDTWLNTQSQMQWHGNVKQYPLLFKGGKYYCKPAFYGVLEAGQEFTE